MLGRRVAFEASRCMRPGCATSQAGAEAGVVGSVRARAAAAAATLERHIVMEDEASDSSCCLCGRLFGKQVRRSVGGCCSRTPIDAKLEKRSASVVMEWRRGRMTAWSLKAVAFWAGDEVLVSVGVESGWQWGR